MTENKTLNILLLTNKTKKTQSFPFGNIHI